MMNDYSDALSQLLGDHTLRDDIANDIGNVLGAVIARQIEDRVALFRTELSWSVAPARLEVLVEDALNTGRIMNYSGDDGRMLTQRYVSRKAYRVSKNCWVSDAVLANG
jgi:hypothetical protein